MSNGAQLRRAGFWDEENRRLLILCFAAVFGWGLAAHAYGFLRAGFSHDMLNALVADSVEDYWKLQLGRPGIVLYRRLFRGPVAAPWTVGLLSLLWLSLSCFLTAKLFRIPGWLFPVLTAGILTVNVSMIGMTAGYLYETDANLFAVLAGVCAVLLWDRLGWKGALAGIPLVAFCTATYQSLVSVPVTLAMLLCLAALLRGDRASAVFRRGLQAVMMLALGVLLYWLGLRLLCALTGVSLSMDGYNSMNRAGLPLTPADRLLAVYRSWIAAFWRPSEAHIEPAVLCVDILLPLAALLKLVPWLFRRGQASGTADAQAAGLPEKLLFLVLTLLLPLGMNTAQLLFPVAVHDLMKYAFWLFRLFCLLPFFLLPSGRHGVWQRCVAAVLVLVVLLAQARTANVIYTRKALEQDACLSFMTRVVYQLEEREDYIPGETPLVFVGIGSQLQERMPGFEDTYDITGCESSTPITKSLVSYSYNTYAAYFRYYLNNPAQMADSGTWMQLQRDARVKEMPQYPDPGCMQMLDGILVVKLSDFRSGALF